MLKQFKKAFTLAEVLIVIGIIGVVAALTLPNLNHATGDKEKVTKVKKIYSTLTEALDRAQVVYGDFETWENGLTENESPSERFAKRVTEFMKISNDCGKSSSCWSNAPLLDIRGDVIFDNYYQEFQDGGCDVYFVTLPDGITLAFHSLSRIRVDIDGPNKGKTQMGNDIFDFSVLNNNGTSLNQLYPSTNPEGWTGDYNHYSTAWVIENGNLDYLKCPDELNWETKTSCE